MITGITVSIKLGSYIYAGTKDPLYLGIFGKNGGQEFALEVNNYEEFDSPNKFIQFKLGDGCCSANMLQVQGSNDPGNCNNPKSFPLNLDSIEYVYLRKLHKLNAVEDDLLQLASARVLLCDVNGNIRKFEKDIKMVFAYECGLQYWLKEVDRPGCKIKVELESVHYGGANIGNDVEYWLRINLINPYSLKIIHIGEDTFNHNSTNVPPLDRRIKNFFIPGCCGSTHTLEFRPQVREHDGWPFADDESLPANAYVEISCDEETQLKPFSIVVDVKEGSKRAKFTFRGTVTTSCT